MDRLDKGNRDALTKEAHDYGVGALCLGGLAISEALEKSCGSWTNVSVSGDNKGVE